MSVLTALFQNATNSQPTPDDVPAPRISMAHLSHVEACSRTPQPPTSISVDQNSECHWRHRDICTTRRQYFRISKN